ncbi:MAG: acyl-[acyl-carrier-protein]--UDP-N-acetylglucosamine O-acyltransferase [Candidatus Muproteobacteria bacterium RBG_16_62_13]|uniref:Acyl-[acyl-carrier-protein]--UDP-N-acetylglucosamine O-acyltransferase n=1 Tax=Candidatus Muproteobacteria bacterium RBG_16_62_13 TaxID=1817756 RepID=A0A1F6T151_9PROT|nr:MAG: acyl-[acyl-carrier-protein]--UDP-N-acetylglucosamine O-acyltransferase [Candidatus Muproteobacteria bacterium RBG_16_62_13]
MIHPQAIIDPGARLAANVQIGAFSIIGPDVEIGEGTWIGPHVVIHGPTVIGRDNRIYQFCSLGEAPQHTGYRGEPTRLVIGDRNVIREYCTMNRATVAGGGETRVGNDGFFMAYCHLAHDCRIGNHVIFANASSLAGHVTVGDHAILGGFTISHQFCRIGAYAITALGSVIFKDIPPYLMAAGNPISPGGINLRGLKRNGFSEDAIAAIRRAYKVLYKSDHTVPEALTELREMSKSHPELVPFTDFVAGSDRGLIR